VPRSHWLVKSEPFKYSWSDLLRDGSTYWDGVRNFQARNNLREMRVGDRALYYHSNEGKEVVGVARVTKTAYQDPTTDDDRWLVVDLEPLKELSEPVTLAQVKSDAALQNIPLVTHSRLSVMPLEKAAFDRILTLGKTKLR
jgi:predicted RNA-binding protein with PUA-like domain